MGSYFVILVAATIEVREARRRAIIVISIIVSIPTEISICSRGTNYFPPNLPALCHS